MSSRPQRRDLSSPPAFRPSLLSVLSPPHSNFQTFKLEPPSISPPFTPSKLPFNPQFLPFPVRYFTLSLIHATLVHVPLDNVPSPRFRFSQRTQLLCVKPIPAPLSSRAQRRFCFSTPAPHLPLITRHSSPMSFPWHSFVPRCGLGYEPGDQPAFLF